MIVSFKIFESSLMATMGRALDFNFDVKIPDSFYISSLDKRIRVSWYDSQDHDIIKKMKRWHKAHSVSDYLKLIQKAFSDILPMDEKDKVVEEDKCVLHLMDRNLYVLFNIKGSRWNPKIHIITILNNEPEEDYDIIFEVDDSFYLI